ncbi:hypothetical protein BSL78_13066 [Apostichopus japonicus]|uniref:Uncharacterized protein n=1 Tax=Stichopus japonicus TaxID=307972 RepID=A0A2G8KQ10_STIJA|nr:hypothetical protein BSL78_13066 [Apostichopus japonicus]
MVKRLFERSHEFETAMPGLMMFSPSNLKKSPFVNLGDFIFTAQRQWIPTTCENATKVAVIIIDKNWSDERWKYLILQNLIIQLQRHSIHFGIFMTQSRERA